MTDQPTCPICGQTIDNATREPVDVTAGDSTIDLEPGPAIHLEPCGHDVAPGQLDST